jgi:hypothetical protein
LFPGEGFPAILELSGSTTGFGWMGRKKPADGAGCTSRGVARFRRASQGKINMAQSALFQPLRVGNLNLCNRIVIAPMCQYSAEDGCMTDWHLIHLGHRALSGAALLTIEATAVLPEGRITWGDVGLWNDETEAAIGRTLDSIRRWSDIPIALQLAHAGTGARRSLRAIGTAGGRWRPQRCHLPTAKLLRSRWIGTGSGGCGTLSQPPPSAPPE